MSKVKLTTFLHTSDNDLKYSIIGNINDKKITYTEQDELKTKVIYDYENNVLVRENKELYMKYIFNINEQTNGILKIKDLNKILSVIIVTNRIETDNYNLEVSFQVENNNFLYKLDIEEE